MGRNVKYGHNIRPLFMGECNGRCVYSDSMVNFIRELKKFGFTYVQISKTLKIKYHTIYDLLRRRTTSELIIKEV